MRNDKGFTLIEIIGVLLILSVLVTVVGMKFVASTKGVENASLKISISTLNEAEKQAWLDAKLEGWTSDEQVLKKIPQKNIPSNLKRTPSTFDGPAKWEVQK